MDVFANFFWVEIIKNIPDKGVNLIMELQALAQIGLAYSKNSFDVERFQRIKDVSAELMSITSGMPTEVVRELFCNESGFQTPKIDTRAAIFKNDKILLVKGKKDNL